MSHSCDDPDMCTFDDEDGCDGPYEEDEDMREHMAIYEDFEEDAPVPDCPFCAPNWDNLTIVSRPSPGVAIIKPLDPVCDGHVLVIDQTHSSDAGAHPGIAAELMRHAAAYVRDESIEANIITSIGRNATQSVMHTHVHVVPRRPHDGLPLPWTPQHEVKSLEAAVAMKRVLQESGSDHRSVGVFQQGPSTYLEALDQEQDRVNARKEGYRTPDWIKEEREAAKDPSQIYARPRQGGKAAKFNVLKASRGENPWED